MVDAAPLAPLRILIVDDEEEHRRLLGRALGKATRPVELAFAEDGAGMREATGRGRYDCVVLDYNLPDAHADELLRELAGALAGCPVVVISSSRDQEVVVKTMREGSVDFVPKAEAVRGGVLWQRVHEALGAAVRAGPGHRADRAEHERLVREMAELREVNGRLQEAHAQVERASACLATLNESLSHEAKIDGLTRLLNRKAIDDCLAYENARALETDRAYGVILIDVDHFKRYNDRHGHAAGDTCLQRIAGGIREAVRAGDYVGRYGGEEVLALLPGADASACRSLAERVRRRVEALGLEHGDSPVGPTVTLSLGVARGPAARWQDVVREADAALYRAKAQGRNAVAA